MRRTSIIHVRVTLPVRRWLEGRAEREHMTLSDYMRSRVIREHIESQPDDALEQK